MKKIYLIFLIILIYGSSYADFPGTYFSDGIALENTSELTQADIDTFTKIPSVMKAVKNMSYDKTSEYIQESCGCSQQRLLFIYIKLTMIFNVRYQNGISGDSETALYNLLDKSIAPTEKENTLILDNIGKIKNTVIEIQKLIEQNY